MPRDLGDVLDYFLPSAGERSAEKAGGEPRVQGPRLGLASQPAPPARPDRPAALPIVALPIGARDVVRAAFAWNLVVETARLGASATLLAPEDSDAAPLWPAAGRGPIGSEIALCDVGNLGDLYRAALDVAVARAADATEGGLVAVRVPPRWLGAVGDGLPLLRWSLLFASADTRDLLESYGVAKRIFRSDPANRVGVTIHGVRRVREARRAFDHVAGVAARHARRPLLSYGMLVDDLHVYRAIIARRPIGLAHPQSRAARALRDVARLLLEDARASSVA